MKTSLVLGHGLLLLVCAALVSCATIMHGTSQNVSFNSTPIGANVEVDGVVMGTTPLVVDLTRKDKHAVTIDLVGYEPHAMILSRKTAGWVWGNIVFGGLPGLAVDAITGGLYKIEPDSIMADLGDARAAVNSDDALHLTVVLRPEDHWQKVGQLTPAL